MRKTMSSYDLKSVRGLSRPQSEDPLVCLDFAGALPLPIFGKSRSKFHLSTCLEA